MAKKAQTGKKKVKKTWFKLHAPKEFGNTLIGETLALEAKSLIGRQLKVSLMDLTNDPKKQNIHMKFRVDAVKEGGASTEIVGYELVPSYMKRVVRKDKDKVADSFLVETKDNVKLRVKPIVITRNKTQRSLKTELRKKTAGIITEQAKNQTFSEFIMSIVSTKTQRGIKDQLKKIYPVVLCEFSKVLRQK